jgi:hypothetical protein
MNPMDVVWQRIIAYSGEVFRQHHGKPFTYSVSGNDVQLDTRDQAITREQIVRAFARMLLNNPNEISDLDGSNYIYAILTDTRIAGT